MVLDLAGLHQTGNGPDPVGKGAQLIAGLAAAGHVDGHGIDIHGQLADVLQPAVVHVDGGKVRSGLPVQLGVVLDIEPADGVVVGQIVDAGDEALPVGIQLADPLGDAQILVIGDTETVVGGDDEHMAAHILRGSGQQRQARLGEEGGLTGPVHAT